MSNVVGIYANWSAWSQPAGNTDTYAPGYAASIDKTVQSPAMILVTLNSLGEFGPLTYGGTSPTQSGGIQSGGGPSFYLFDLVANPPANSTIAGFTTDGGTGMWTALTVSVTARTETLCNTAPSASNVDPLSLNFAGLNSPGYLIVTAATTAVGLSLASTDPAPIVSSVSPNAFGNGVVLVAYQFATTAPVLTYTSSDGSNVFNANSAVFYAGFTVTVQGEFRGPKVFAPVPIANAGSINPKIYEPYGQNTTVKA